MSRSCDICKRGTQIGHNVPRKGLAKKKGGTGSKVGIRSKRTFMINLHNKTIMVEGKKKKVRICMRCLKTLDKVAS